MLALAHTDHSQLANASQDPGAARHHRSGQRPTVRRPEDPLLVAIVQFACTAGIAACSSFRRDDGELAIAVATSAPAIGLT
jgi:hypothetical protein